MGGWQNHLEHHRDGLLTRLGRPPFTVSVCLEKVFCTVGLRRRVEKGMLGFRDDSHDPSSQMTQSSLKPSDITQLEVSLLIPAHSALWITVDTCICMDESFAVQVKLSQHCYLAIPPIQDLSVLK